MRPWVWLNNLRTTIAESTHPPIPTIKEEDMNEGNDDDDNEYDDHVKSDAADKVIPLLQEESMITQMM